LKAINFSPKPAGRSRKAMASAIMIAEYSKLRPKSEGFWNYGRRTVKAAPEKRRHLQLRSQNSQSCARKAMASAILVAERPKLRPKSDGFRNLGRRTTRAAPEK
jgi:catalase (peroxidase I)